MQAFWVELMRISCACCHRLTISPQTRLVACKQLWSKMSKLESTARFCAAFIIWKEVARVCRSTWHCTYACKAYLKEAIGKGLELNLYGVFQQPLCVEFHKLLPVGASHGYLATPFFEGVLPRFSVVVIFHLKVATDYVLYITLHVKQLLQTSAKLWEVFLEILHIKSNLFRILGCLEKRSWWKTGSEILQHSISIYSFWKGESSASSKASRDVHEHSIRCPQAFKNWACKRIFSAMLWKLPGSQQLVAWIASAFCRRQMGSAHPEWCHCKLQAQSACQAAWTRCCLPQPCGWTRNFASPHLSQRDSNPADQTFVSSCTSAISSSWLASSGYVKLVKRMFSRILAQESKVGLEIDTLESKTGLKMALKRRLYVELKTFQTKISALKRLTCENTALTSSWKNSCRQKGCIRTLKQWWWLQNTKELQAPFMNDTFPQLVSYHAISANQMHSLLTLVRSRPELSYKVTAWEFLRMQVQYQARLLTMIASGQLYNHCKGKKSSSSTDYVNPTLATPPWSTPSSATALDVKCTTRGSFKSSADFFEISVMAVVSRFSRVTWKCRCRGLTLPSRSPCTQFSQSHSAERIFVITSKKVAVLSMLLWIQRLWD